MKSSPLKTILIVAVAVVVALGVAACGSSSSSNTSGGSTGGESGGSSSNGGGGTVALELAGQAGCPFCIAIQHGAEAAAKEEGIELSVQSPAKFDTSVQVSQLASVLATKPEALILEPLDANALIAPVNQFKQAGIPTIMVDTTVNDPSLPLSVITSNNKTGGELAAEQLNELTGGKGQVLYLGYTPGASTTDQRQEGFDEKLKSYPGLEQVQPQYSPDEPTEAASKVQATLQANPELKGIFASDELVGIGAANALKAAGKVGQVKVVAFDGAPDEVEALENGTFNTLIVQKAYEMGQEAVRQAAAYLNEGKKPAKETNPDYIVVTKKNLNSPEVQKYLYPER
ncbi:MAG: substrate-binding domain-containing protein [Actinobacteria bacterium]|nr:substrate-binding domain-containing protein [Actinomycetota bacterium]